MNRRELMTSALALTLSYPASGAAGFDTLGPVLETFVDDLLLTMPQIMTVMGRDNGENAGSRSLLNDRSQAASDRLRALLAAFHHKLDSLKSAYSAGPQEVDFRTASYLAETSLQGFEFGYGDPNVGGTTPYIISQLSGAYRTVPSFLGTQHPVESATDAEAYLDRLDGFARQLDQETDRARADFAKGAVPPDFILRRSVEQMRALASARAEDNELVQALVRRATASRLPGQWSERAATIVRRDVYPALNRQMSLLEDVSGRAASEAGVWHLPDGDAYYRYAVRASTTTDMSGEDIHALGLDLVADFMSKADALLRSAGMTLGSVGTRMAALRQRPDQLYADNDKGREDLLAYLKAVNSQIESQLPRYFGQLPEARLDIVRMSQSIEAGAPGATYQPPSLDGTRPGLFSMNLRDLAEWPRFELATLVFHEGIPGHHLQNALMIEASGLPTLRRLPLFSGYIEGWGLYAEQLADEMGIYDTDPLARIGYMSSMLLRAARLVVDSGIHYKRWGRERAVAYMHDTLGIPSSMAAREIERYCVQPAQASSYMLGWRVWTDARAAVQRRQGQSFDLPGFHDRGLLAGNMPLDVLAQFLSAA